MIDSINSHFAAAMHQPPKRDNSQPLSQEQQQLIEDTLANYDTDQLSASDAASIVEVFSEAGIQPGAGLEAAMSDAGFDARTVGDMAGATGSRPPGPPTGGGGQIGQLNLSDEMLSNLNELLDRYLGDTREDSEKESLLADIKEILAEGAPEGGLVSVKA